MTEYVHPTPFVAGHNIGQYGQSHTVYSHNPGLSLRDYFAAAALTGLLARSGFSEGTTASWAYEYADAMLKAGDRE